MVITTKRMMFHLAAKRRLNLPQALTALDSGTQSDEELFNQFLTSDIHQVLSVCAQLRPPVSISVLG